MLCLWVHYSGINALFSLEAFLASSNLHAEYASKQQGNFYDNVW